MAELWPFEYIGTVGVYTVQSHKLWPFDYIGTVGVYTVQSYKWQVIVWTISQ